MFVALRLRPDSPELAILTFVIFEAVAILNPLSGRTPAPPAQMPAPSPDLFSRAEPQLRKRHPHPKDEESRSPRQHSPESNRQQPPLVPSVAGTGLRPRPLASQRLCQCPLAAATSRNQERSSADAQQPFSPVPG